MLVEKKTRKKKKRKIILFLFFIFGQRIAGPEYCKIVQLKILKNNFKKFKNFNIKINKKLQIFRSNVA